MKTRKDIEAQHNKIASRLETEKGHLASNTRGYLDALEWVLSEDESQAAPRPEESIEPHYHEAKYVDEELVRECNKCGRDLMHESHFIQRAPLTEPDKSLPKPSTSDKAEL